jgi:uncharacterized NAD(P)/FAD-binding protein YdhS
MLQGWVSTDELSLGILTTDNGQAIDSAGSQVDDLHVVGTLRKPSTWESTAVPELRMQAETVAREIVVKVAQVARRVIGRNADKPASWWEF